MENRFNVNSIALGRSACVHQCAYLTSAKAAGSRPLWPPPAALLHLIEYRFCDVVKARNRNNLLRGEVRLLHIADYLRLQSVWWHQQQRSFHGTHYNRRRRYRAGRHSTKMERELVNVKAKLCYNENLLPSTPAPSPLLNWTPNFRSRNSRQIKHWIVHNIASHPSTNCFPSAKQNSTVHAEGNLLLFIHRCRVALGWTINNSRPGGTL